MGRTWILLGGMIAALLFSAGCKSEPKLKPADHPEDFVLPPLSDARFSSPDYPKAAFNTNNDIRKTPDQTDGLPTGGMSGPNRFATSGARPY
jgi:hypothetical protein